MSRMFGPRPPLDGLPAAGVTPMAVGRSLTPRSGLHICRECRADAVNPAHAAALDDDRWTMLLRCGACGATFQRVVYNEDAERYDRDLDRGWNAIGRATQRLEREQMVEWADAFVVALARDLIDASDFARR
jgi:hypothetical protein